MQEMMGGEMILPSEHSDREKVDALVQKGREYLTGARDSLVKFFTESTPQADQMAYLRMVHLVASQGGIGVASEVAKARLQLLSTDKKNNYPRTERRR